ncbi:CmpA/NrtA family ABC transporter substrate-binding protein [Phreatobacter stygius]|uniref:ABC transporter substrate-binding protein n=1 Tax=Phreatobacter stygius TaxID=1940610 RepID=A0A4D7B2T4_9HYPH|nr:CmpA/NrtA family ABC transporter substrate-binding protein [Phreatobacter stygius]QCI64888.1 ABC transporter substrate-binding protein [Phreatobacter stygius]
MKQVSVGFIPLTDAAPLIAARECGFAAKAGIELDLVREVSWANIRDKLSVGLFDAAHMLAPMALASALGIGHVRVPLSAPLSLGLNGDAITVSSAFAGEMGEIPDDPFAAVGLIAAALKRRESAGLAPPAFGIVFPFSTHNYLLRAYLAAGGIDPDRDVQLVVIPPSLMVSSLEKGLIDGFCVGSPWNSVAVDKGIGRIIAAGASLYSAMPGKVLAVGDAYASANAPAAVALVAAVVEGAAWCAAPANAEALALMLSAPEYLDVPAELIRRTIDGRLTFAPGDNPVAIPDFLRFDVPRAVRPDAGRFLWLYAQMVRWRQTRFSPGAVSRIRAWAVQGLAAATSHDMPDDVVGDPVGSRVEPAFDPDGIEAYLDGFDARGQVRSTT